MMARLVDEFGNLLTPPSAAWLMSGGSGTVRLLGQCPLKPIYIPNVVYESEGCEVWFDNHGWMHTKDQDGKHKKELVEY